MTSIERIKHRITSLFDAGDLPALEKICDQLNEITAHAGVLRIILADSLQKHDSRLEMEGNR